MSGADQGGPNIGGWCRARLVALTRSDAQETSPPPLVSLRHERVRLQMAIWCIDNRVLGRDDASSVAEKKARLDEVERGIAEYETADRQA